MEPKNKVIWTTHYRVTAISQFSSSSLTLVLAQNFRRNTCKKYSSVHYWRSRTWAGQLHAGGRRQPLRLTNFFFGCFAYQEDKCRIIVYFVLFSLTFKLLHSKNWRMLRHLCHSMFMPWPWKLYLLGLVWLMVASLIRQNNNESLITNI